MGVNESRTNKDIYCNDPKISQEFSTNRLLGKWCLNLVMVKGYY